MATRDPLIDPRAGDVITVDGVTRTIIYTSVYGKVFYKNPADARKWTDLNSFRKWAEKGEATPGSHPGWNKPDVRVRKDVLAEAENICARFSRDFQHPTQELLIETLLEFGVAVALGSQHGREKVYAILRRKLEEKG